MVQINEPYLEQILSSSTWLGPEIYLTIIIFILSITSAFLKNIYDQLGSYIGFLIALPLLYFYSNQLHTQPTHPLFGDMIVINDQLLFFKLLMTLGCVCYYIYSIALKSKEDDFVGEHHILIYSILLGANFTVMANHWLIVVLGLETMSLASYALVLFGGNRLRASAGIKYVIFGAMSIAVSLFSISILFALEGNFSFDVLFKTYENADVSLVNYFFSSLLLFAILFKISAFPLHIWVPAVYHAIPQKLAAYFSYTPKIAGLILLLNITKSISDLDQRVTFLNMLGIIILATLFVGNLSALSQKNSKKLIAYSSIAHSGFLLIALFNMSEDGNFAIAYYAFIYLFLNFAGFYIIEILSIISKNEQIDAFSGLGNKYPFWGIITIIIMIGLTGLPPTIGFHGKVTIFLSLYDAAQFQDQPIYLIVFALGLLNVAIALYYYLRIPYYMFFKTEKSTSVDLNIKTKVVATIFVAPILVLFFINNQVINFVNLFNF